MDFHFEGLQCAGCISSGWLLLLLTEWHTATKIVKKNLNQEPR